MEQLSETLQNMVDALRFPLDNPDQTLVITLVIVVAGLLLAAVLIALASPDAHNSEEDAGEDAAFGVADPNHENHLGD